jgi:hypothetical protein
VPKEVVNLMLCSGSTANVRAAFAKQAAICAASGAPFTGRVCGLIGERLERSGEIGRRVLNWAGNPSHEGDALALRLAGGLHGLARSGKDAGLAAVYPPNVAPGDDEVLWEIVAGSLVAHAAQLDRWLDGPPQTNEVGRSAGLMAGLLVLAERFGLPFALYELGASAGLNTRLDRYEFRLGEVEAGEAGSAVRIAPDWRGVSPPSAEVRVARRAGVDLNPLDPGDATTRERLAAYVWADQRERLGRLEAALHIAAGMPVEVERADAADWLERRLALESEPGVCRVVMHTIAFQYFPPEVAARVRARIEAAGARATEEAPLAWLTFEAEQSGFERQPVLRLRAWPGGEGVILARGHPHGSWFEWVGLRQRRRGQRKVHHGEHKGSTKDTEGPSRRSWRRPVTGRIEGYELRLRRLVLIDAKRQFRASASEKKQPMPVGPARSLRVLCERFVLSVMNPCGVCAHASPGTDRLRPPALRLPSRAWPRAPSRRGREWRRRPSGPEAR